MRLLLSAVALLTAFGFASADEPKATPTKKDDKPAEAKPEPGKQTYTSKEGKYSVEFPYKNKLNETTQVVPVGEEKCKLHLAAFETTAVGYVVGHIDYPESLIENADLETLLDNCMGGMLKGMQGKEKETSKIKIHGVKAREMTFEVPSMKGHGKARAVIVGNRLYQIIAIDTDAKAPGIDSFVDSFKLTDPPKKDK